MNILYLKINMYKCMFLYINLYTKSYFYIIISLVLNMFNNQHKKLKFMVNIKKKHNAKENFFT